MANTLGVYNPIFYAQEALIHLEKALGMANTVHRGFEDERNARRLGDTINIRKPSTFTVEAAPDETGQDLNTETTVLTLNQWREVKFKLSDKELAFTGQRIIDDHIRPAAYALADDIDQKLYALRLDIPWFYDLASVPGSTVVDDITGPRKVLFDNNVPLSDAENMFYMINGGLEQGFLNLSNFTQWQGSGARGVEAQLRGSIGRRYGVEIFANQNVGAFTAGDITVTTPLTDGSIVKGATSVVINDTTLTGTMKQGDSFVLAGNTQRYAITADATASSNAITLNFFPSAVIAYSDGDVVTFRDGNNFTTDAIMYHRNAFALAMAPLPDMARALGANVRTITDPITGLSIRARMYYVGNSSEVHIALDVLYGVKTLEANLAMRAQD